MSATGNRSFRVEHVPPIRTEDEIEAEQKHAMAQWVRGLTPDEKVELERLGIIESREKKASKKRGRTPSVQLEGICSGNFDHLPSDVLDPREALMVREEEADEELKRNELMLLGFVLPHVIDAPDARLEASILALALDIGLRQGITAEELCKRHGIEADCLLLRVRGWKVKFDVCRRNAGGALLRVVLSPILASRKPALEAEMIAAAARFSLGQGVSMTTLGQKYGICRAAISRRVREWVKHLELPLPRGCKEHTENYQLFNVRKRKSDQFL